METPVDMELPDGVPLVVHGERMLFALVAQLAS